MGLRIVATPVGGGQAFVIADGNNLRGAGGSLAPMGQGITITFDAKVQDEMIPRAEEPVRFDRGNETASLPLEVEYEFDTAGKCFAFWNDLQKTVPRLADITVTNDGVARTYPKVWLRPLQVKTIGEVSVSVSYPIRFGLVAQPANV